MPTSKKNAPGVDHTAFPLPSNLPSALLPTYHEMMTLKNVEAAVTAQLEVLSAKVRAQVNLVIDGVCPAKVNDELPIAKQVLLVVEERHLKLVDGQLQWSVEGVRVTYKDGARTVGRTMTLTQADYEALPEGIKAQTVEGIQSANTAVVVDTSKPLRLSEPMVSMFRHVQLHMVGQHFERWSAIGTFRLPLGVAWNGEGTTKRIYGGLIKQGVLSLALNEKGAMTCLTDELADWRVCKGPRFDECVALVEDLKQQALLSLSLESSPSSKRPASRKTKSTASPEPRTYATIKT